LRVFEEIAMSKLKHVLLACALVIASGCGSLPRWVEQGPGPILQGQVEGIPGNPVAGAINAIAVDRTRPGTVYLGTVNGGVWKTTNVNAPSPNWKPLTDLQLPALSINSIAISPLDRSTIFAGTGSTSSLSRMGSPGFGVIRSTNGGLTWSILAESTFAGLAINSIVPTTLTTGGLEGQVVLAASVVGGGGVFRSTDGGESFTRISGSGGLPDFEVSRLVRDPTNPTRLYAAIPADTGAGAASGVYRSDDAGLTWFPVNTGLDGVGTSVRILLAVSRNTGVVYAMVINLSGVLSGVFRSANGGTTWTPMGVPVPTIHPGGQGALHAAIAADPVNPNIVYVGGDRQNLPSPHGCFNFSGNLYRGDASLADPWQTVVCNGAQGTSPHADSRDMDFDAHGNLLQADDGGIYRLDNPNSPSRRWVSLNGNIRPTEVHSAAYDAVSRVVFGGTQDNGTVVQNAPGDRTFTVLLQGDGGVVAVDDAVEPSVRYSSFQFLGAFNRTTWDADNNQLTFTGVGLQIVSGPGAGLRLFQFDPNIQFYNPYELNRIEPNRMLLGTANIYESADGGDTLANLLFTGQFITSLSYGGRLDGVPNPGAFYVGLRIAAPAAVLHRASDGAAITGLTTYPGLGVADLVMDPQNTRHVYVLDRLNRVWASFDSGATWSDLTADLAVQLPQVHTIELFSPNAAGRGKVLLVGGLGGVFRMRDPGTPGASWSRLGLNLPHGLVLDLRYNYRADVLTAGIVGRGIWTLESFTRGNRNWQSAAKQTQPNAAKSIAVPAGLPKIPPAPRPVVEQPVVEPGK